ncbi:MAG TPA: hypothetical protein DEA44_16935 [Firmicutes bacterium]|nr:hypothetical protein [Bacillota bacterium]
MDSEVLTAILGFLGAVVGSVAGILTAAKLTNHRLCELEKKVDKHNNLVERMVVVEQRSKSNTHRLDQLERGA